MTRPPSPTADPAGARFGEVRLHANDLESLHAFYVDLMGLPLLAASADALAVGAGATRLVFERVSGAVAAQHVAFNVPENKLPAAKAWLAGRVELLTEDGRDEFRHAARWNADAVYFRDPASHILEFIARHDLPNAAPGAFGPGDVLEVSEVGLPVADVPAAVACLGAALGLAPWPDQGADFAPVGDGRGLLIVVRRGRPWFPTATPAAVTPIAVTLRGAAHGRWTMPGFPYVFDVGAG